VKNRKGSSLRSQDLCARVHLGGRPAASRTAAQADDGPSLEVNVIFTTAQATMTALNATQGLARNLRARISLLVPQAVPMQFSFASPPVSVAFLARRSCAMAISCREDIEIKVPVYLCGDKRQCLVRVLKPASLVVIGGRERCWPTPEQKLARFLRSEGHRVVLIDPRDHGAALVVTSDPDSA